MSAPLLSTVVVSWASREDVLALVERFPAADRHELIVVDNGAELSGVRTPQNVRVVTTGGNLGFAGGANLGAKESRAQDLFFLNPDTIAKNGAYDQIVEGLASRPEAAGLAPRLVDEAGRSQFRWQLRPLPTPLSLLGHAFFWDGRATPAAEPEPGAKVAQPAAAALAIRRERFEALGGFDERFFPAWFEDVDLARRLATAGDRVLYWPRACFVHRRGASLDALGYAAFLAAYDRNLSLYLRRHHGRGWELAFRALVPFGALLRLAALPVRRPLRAASRADAAAALLGAASGALDLWQRRLEGAGLAR